jgi:hypothetical protein
MYINRKKNRFSWPSIIFTFNLAQFSRNSQTSKNVKHFRQRVGRVSLHLRSHFFFNSAPEKTYGRGAVRDWPTSSINHLALNAAGTHLD